MDLPLQITARGVRDARALTAMRTVSGLVRNACV
jgi:hypothetical protein